MSNLDRIEAAAFQAGYNDGMGARTDMYEDAIPDEWANAGGDAAYQYRCGWQCGACVGHGSKPEYKPLMSDIMAGITLIGPNSPDAPTGAASEIRQRQTEYARRVHGKGWGGTERDCMRCKGEKRLRCPLDTDDWRLCPLPASLAWP